MRFPKTIFWILVEVALLFVLVVVYYICELGRDLFVEQFRLTLGLCLTYFTILPLIPVFIVLGVVDEKEWAEILHRMIPLPAKRKRRR